MNPNVAFELGVAHGLGKRILIVADEAASPAVDMLGDPYIRTRPDNAQAIEFAMRQLLAAPPQVRKRPPETANQTHPIGRLADVLLAKLHGDESLTEDRLAQLIHQAVAESGVTAAAGGKTADAPAHFDLAVWSDDLEPWVHNPLIIELRTDVNSKKDVQTIVEQIRGSMERTRVSTALVLYRRASLPAVEEMRASQILFMSVEEFLGSLRDTAFAEVIRRLRDRSLHGAT
jgi:hypothetical protein